jgi:hypothetical protein
MVLRHARWWRVVGVVWFVTMIAWPATAYALNR